VGFKMNKKLKILLSSYSMFILASGLLGPIYAVFVENIGGDLITAGSAYGLFSIVTGLMILFISRWEDRIKHQEKLILVGFCLSAIGFLGYLFIQLPWHLFVVQIVLGMAAAIRDPAYDSIYSKNLDKGKFASEWGMWEAMYYILTALAAITGGIMAKFYGFRMLFIIMFALSIIGIFISIRLIKT